MTRPCLLMLVLAFVAVGCTDTPDSVCREYRNATNEAIDAMTMVTSENSAKVMEQRVFGTLQARYEAIDRRLDIVRSNRLKKEFVKEIYESRGVEMYLAEIDINRQRFSMELTRLRSLYNEYLQKEKERSGLDEPKESEACPNLAKIMNKGLDPVRNQLMRPKLVQMIQSFPDWKVPEYETIYKAKLDKWEARKKASSQQDVTLVY